MLFGDMSDSTVHGVIVMGGGDDQVTILHLIVFIDAQIAAFRERLRVGGRFSFRSALEACRTRMEIVVSFLAVLELLKAGECEAVQERRWGDIEVVALARREVSAG